MKTIRRSAAQRYAYFASTLPRAVCPGQGVVEKVRTERPQDYPKIVASVMPKPNGSQGSVVHRSEPLIYPMTSLQRSSQEPS